LHNGIEFLRKFRQKANDNLTDKSDKSVPIARDFITTRRSS